MPEPVRALAATMATIYKGHGYAEVILSNPMRQLPVSGPTVKGPMGDGQQGTSQRLQYQMRGSVQTQNNEWDDQSSSG